MSASMTASIDSALSHWQEEWDRASVQLNDFTSVIKIKYDIWFYLGQDGRDFFVNQASALLNRPIEFFQDNTNQRRVILANRQDLQAHIPCHIEPWSQYGLPRFFPTMPNSFTGPSTSSRNGHVPINMHFGSSSVNMNINNYSRSQSQQSGTSVGFPPGQNFNVPPPIGAPIYPMPQMEVPVHHAPISNAGQASRGKRKALHTLQSEARASRRKVSEDKKDKRPANGWILYRSSRSRAVRLENPGIENGAVSKIIGGEWKAMSEIEKDPWHERSDQLAEKHFEENPETRYKPAPTRISKRRAERAEREAASQVQPENPITPLQSQAQPENQSPLDQSQAQPENVIALEQSQEQPEDPSPLDQSQALPENLLTPEQLEELFGVPEKVELPVEPQADNETQSMGALLGEEGFAFFDEFDNEYGWAVNFNSA
ncbi:hypothetical protein F4678DRAFT_484675 [Xylaria arbuscula]|nr:hypothetical protein F4678DRAFT_484675 [Xylaria arbuscula]